jgi:thiosulfate/3-mercaptopyruvate sulfurtransferase
MRLMIFLVLLVSAGVQAGVLPDVLVTPTWLQQHLEQVTVLGVYKNLKAEQAGIYSAKAIDFSKLRGKSQEDDRTLDKMRVDAATFSALMQSVGVNQDSIVVISYAGQDSDQFTMATRLYWTLKYYGLENIAIVNGGDQSWQQAGFPVAAMATSAAQPGKFSSTNNPP